MYPSVPKHPDFVTLERRMLTFWSEAEIFRKQFQSVASLAPTGPVWLTFHRPIWASGGGAFGFTIGDNKTLAAAAKDRVRVADDDTWSDIFSKILVEHVEPNLGQGRLTVLFEYPAPEAALARTKASPEYWANKRVAAAKSTS